MGGETQRLGKGGELAVIGEFIARDFDVYTPVSDTENIDCIIRTNNKHIDVQIKHVKKSPCGMLKLSNQETIIL